MQAMRVCGIMSGTSVDGIDVAICDLRGFGSRTAFELLAFHSVPWPQEVRQAILSVSDANTHTATISRLNFLLGELYADAVQQTCRLRKVPLSSIQLIGCHGQTIFHEAKPFRYLGRPVASTYQIGESAVIRERTGVPVVSNFREADVAAGGNGAPLVPFVDYLLFRSQKLGRVALNIGGIANITAIPPRAKPEEVLAFDTGPGNMVIDALVSRHTGGKQKYDRGGAIAARGRVRDHLLERLLAEAYYAAPPPKSAGREQYGEAFLKRLLASRAPLPDLIATATELTAVTIAEAVLRFAARRQRVDELIISGGGVHNRHLQRRLAALLHPARIRTSTDYGVPADAKEAIAFAILAYETWHGRPANLPSATGARHATILGKVAGRQP
jgi:anhydro-N-acetylmuramic acid kinase